MQKCNCAMAAIELILQTIKVSEKCRDPTMSCLPLKLILQITKVSAECRDPIVPWLPLKIIENYRLTKVIERQIASYGQMSGHCVDCVKN